MSFPTSSAAEEEDGFPEPGVASWYDAQPGKRLLRKPNYRMGTADVYEQHKNQEEDMLTTERLKKGYQVPVTHYELQSLIFNASENKLLRLDRAPRRTYCMISSIVHRRGEYHMNFDSNRKVAKGEMPRFAKIRFKRILEDRVKFFSALFRGTPLQYLQKKVPYYRRKELLLLEFYDYQIRYDRAIWCVKLVSILGFNCSAKAQKKALLDLATLEWSQACGKVTYYLLLALRKTYKKSRAAFRESVKMWYYMTRFMMYMFQDGVVDKHEFLNDLTEMFNVFFIRGSLANAKILELFMEYYIFFLDDLSSSLILARRASSLLCKALGLLSEINEAYTKTQVYKNENKHEFMGHQDVWTIDAQPKFDFEDYNRDHKEFIDPDDFFRFVDELPDAAYFEDYEDKTAEQVAEEELQTMEAPRRARNYIYSALKSVKTPVNDQIPVDLGDELYIPSDVESLTSPEPEEDPEEGPEEDPRSQSVPSPTFPAGPVSMEEAIPAYWRARGPVLQTVPQPAPQPVPKPVQQTVPKPVPRPPPRNLNIKSEQVDPEYEKNFGNPVKSKNFNINIKAEPMDYDEYSTEPPQPLQPPQTFQQRPKSPEKEKAPEPAAEPPRWTLEELPKNFLSKNLEVPAPWTRPRENPIERKRAYNLLCAKRFPVKEDVFEPFKDPDSPDGSRPASPIEPIPVKKLHKTPPKKVMTDDDEFGHIPAQKRKINPKLANGKYSETLFVYYLINGGVAFDPKHDGDEMDFSNPTPPEAPPPPPPVEFETSPSASPAPDTDKEDEDGKSKEGGDKAAEKSTDKPAEEKEASEKEKTGEKKDGDKPTEEKSKKGEKADGKKAVDEHLNDLIIPMDVEAEAATKRNSATNSKDDEAEDANKVAGDAPVVEATHAAGTSEKKPEAEVTPIETNDVEMESVDPATNKESTSDSTAEKSSDSQEPMEVDDPQKKLPSPAADKAGDDASKKTKEGKKPDTPAIELVDLEALDDIPLPTDDLMLPEEDEIQVIEKPKHPDADFCEVVEVVEKDKDKTPEKATEGEKEAEKDAEKLPEPAPVVESVPEPVKTPEKPKTPEPPRLYTAEEIEQLKKDKRRQRMLDRLTDAFKIQMESDKKYEENNIHPSFKVYDQSRSFRRPLHLLSSMVQYLAFRTPESFVWNNLEVPRPDKCHKILPQLCGSPLDHLPCELHELPVMEGNDGHVEHLRLRHHEIVRRSQAADENWLPGGADVLQYGRIIDACVDVIGLMDCINVERPNSIFKVSERLFNFREKFAKEEALLRIKLMFKWCISEEREGSFRPVYCARMLEYGLNRSDDGLIGGWQIMDLFFNFMATEGPKPGMANYQAKFDACAGIMIEMIRHKLFTVADILRELEKDLDIDYTLPLMARQRKQKMPKISKKEKTPEEPDNTKLIHFTTEHTPKRLFMGRKMDLLERMIIMLPQFGNNKDSDEYKIRNQLLFGLRPSENIYFRRAKTICQGICKEFDSKSYIEFNDYVTAHKKLNQSRLDDILRQFRAQTYHDQHVILEKIVIHLTENIGSFLEKKNGHLPAPEVVNIICEMYEYSMDITSIFDFFEVLHPYLKAVDEKVASFEMDLVPDMYHTEIAYIFVSFFMKHYQRFLLHKRNNHIVNQLYYSVRKMMMDKTRFITCWGRVIAIFVNHIRPVLIDGCFRIIHIEGNEREFARAHPNKRPFNLECSYFNEEFAGSKLSLRGATMRYDSFADMKWIVDNLKVTVKRKNSKPRTPNRYSFVIRAFMEARKHGQNFDRINELANYCANVTANDPPLSEYWIGAIKGLCCLCIDDSSQLFKEMAKKIDISDCSTHYSLSTFITCLAGKAAFYIPRLLHKLTEEVFSQMLHNDGRLTSHKTKDVKRKSANKTTETRTLSEAEPGVCLSLLIIAGLCCPGDEPFGLSVHYRGIEKKKKRFRQTADERIMHMFHWLEMDKSMFRTLASISKLLEALQSRCRDANLVLPQSFQLKHPIVDPNHPPPHEKAPYRPQFLFNIAKAVFFTICEQDWVTIRMYQFVRINKMEPFNQEKLKTNCLGQQLLRISLRRKTERSNVHSLFEAHKISKKATVDKVLSFMNLWNFRATLFDLMLMIKEISPDGNTRHAQQGAIAADALMSEIGKCCRDMFLAAYKADAKMPNVKKLMDFRFGDISKYWLLAPLVRMCPKPINIPPQYANTQVQTVAAKFLREASALMDTPPTTTPKERLLQCSWAMSKLPFINMILTCLACEKTQSGKDTFLNSVYQQLQREVFRDHNKRSNWTNRPEHRDCTVLRVNLIAYMYKEILKPTHVEVWGLLLYQLMFHGIINPSRERYVFENCYDMLQHMVLWTLVNGDNMNSHDRYGSIRVRWPNYAGLMKKIRKEIQDRHVHPSRTCLLRFLPIGKLQTSTISYKKYHKRTIRPSATKSKKFMSNEGIRSGKYVYLPEEKVKTNAYDHMKNIPDGIQKGGWKFRMFQTTRLDKVAKSALHQLRAKIPHTHIGEFKRPCNIMLDNMSEDFYLRPPEVEITKTVEPVADDEETAAVKKPEEETAEKKKDEAKKADEKTTKADDEKKKDETADAKKDNEKQKEEKDKPEDSAKAKTDDVTAKDTEKDTAAPTDAAKAAAAPVAAAPDANKEMDTSTPKPAPVTRETSTTRGRGGGRKRNSGGRAAGGSRAKRTNSRANANAETATAADTSATTKAGPSGGGSSNYHAAMRANQPPMSNGSSDETKANIRNLLNRKQEKRNSREFI